MAKLIALAQVIRSKNSGPFEITFDVIFDDRETYQKVKDSGVLTVNLVCGLYGVQPSDIRAFMFFNPAQAFKFTLKRGWPQGSSGERGHLRHTATCTAARHRHPWSRRSKTMSNQENAALTGIRQVRQIRA